MKGFKHFTHEDRIKIEALLKEKLTPKEIALHLGFSLSSVYAELKRGRCEQLSSEYKTIIIYSADVAQRDYEYKASNKGPPLKIGSDHKFVKYIEKKIIKEKYSPDAIIGELRRKGSNFDTEICTKTLYNYIDSGLFLNLTNKDLPCKGNRKRTYKKVKIVRTKKPLCKSIETRPAEVANRDVFGHWEMDTVIGKAKGKGEVLLVLTERKTREEIIMKLQGKLQECVCLALNRLERKYGCFFKQIFKTITIDNGSEFLDEKKLEKSCRNKQNRVDAYYCHPFSSWERGSNENANKLIRRFIPKGDKMEKYNHSKIQEIQTWINNYPRKIFNYMNSHELFTEELKKIGLG